MRKRVAAVLLAICLCAVFMPSCQIAGAAAALPGSVDYKEAYTKYAEVLDLYQRCVKTIVVDGGYAEENPWSMLPELTTPSWNTGLTGEDFGFTFRDLNQNGTPELILLTQKLPYIVAIYSLSDGEPRMLIDCWPRNTCDIREDGTLVNRGSNGADDSETKFYSISPDGASLVLIGQADGYVDSFPEMELDFISVSTLWDKPSDASTDAELLKLASDLWDMQYNMIWTIPPAAWFQTEWSSNPLEYGGKRWFPVISDQVSSVDDVQAYWETYFTEDFAPPEWYLQNYAEIGGQLCSAESGIGGDMTLVGFEFDHIISRDDTAVRILVLEKRDEYLDTLQAGNIITKEFVYTMVRENDRWKCGDVTYTDGTPFLSKFGVCDSEGIVVPFTDVKSDTYYAQAVKWAVENRVTAGTSNTTFSPDATCSKAQILSFLWRASGSPEPAAANPFRDVKDSDYFCKAALWAAEKGLVSGSVFGADTPCTRASTMEYMWRAAGSPAAAGKAGFDDVSGNAGYAQAVSWAVEHGITAGTTETTFSPNDICTRGQIVTFLYRAFAK